MKGSSYRYKGRDSNFELLRIICMVMIILLHAFGRINTELNQFNSLVSIVMNSICNVAVSCFILISGYFGVKFDVRKILRITIMTLFYSISIMIMQLIIGIEMNLLDIIKSFIPIISSKYWFISCYLVLVVLSPFLNTYIDNISKKELQKLIIVLIFLFSIIPSFLYFDITKDGGKGIVNMIIMYILGRYIKKYMQRNLNIKILIISLIILLVLNSVLNITIFYITGKMINLFARDNSIVIILSSVIILLIFANVRIKSVIINSISKHILSVYIMHEAILSYFSINIYKIDLYINKPYLIFIVLLNVISVFTVCICIDYIRLIIFSKIEMNLIELIIKNIDKLKIIFSRKVKDRKFKSVVFFG